MVFLELLITQISRFASNIPIFPTEFFTLILLRVPVRVKIRVNFAKRANTQAGGVIRLGLRAKVYLLGMKKL